MNTRLFTVTLLLTATGTLASAQHPSIYLKPESLQALRERAANPEMARFRDALLAHCEYLLKAEPIQPPAKASTADNRSGGELQKARGAQGRVVTLALGYLLTGNKAYADRALAELWCFTDVWASWVDPFHGDPKYFDLMVGEMCMTAGLAYDWLYDAMTEEQRTKLRQVTIERGLDRYLFHTDFATRGREAKGWWAKNYSNWNPVCNGGALIAALALRNEYEPWQEVVKRATGSWMLFFNCLGKEGGWDEGTGYWRYGMRYAIMGLEALHSVTGQGQEIFDLPGVRGTGFFPIVFSPGGVAVSFGDAAGVGADPILYLLGARYKEPAFIWFQDTYGKIPDPKRDDWPVEALALLWRPVGEDWLPKPDTVPALPTAKAFSEIGWAVFADAQPKPNVICGFKCGDLAANHTQLDNNALNLWAYGQWLAIDLGSGSYTREYFSASRWSLYEVKTIGHNGVLVNGQGQKEKTKGRMSALETGDGYALIAGDATANYADAAITKAQRTMLFLGLNGAVVVDRVETAAPSEATVLWHSWSEPALSDPAATLSSGEVRLDIAAWSATPLKWDKALDPGKDRKSGNVKPDWVARVTAPAATAHLIVTHLYPRRAAMPAATGFHATGDANRLELDVANAKWVLVPGEIGYRVGK